MNRAEFNANLKNAHSSMRAFEALYREYYAKIVLHISLKFGKSVAHDVAQEFFSELIQGKFKDVGRVDSPVAYVYRVSDNIAINAFKKEAKYVSLGDRDFGQESDLDTVIDVKALLAPLEEEERRLIYLRFFEGYSLKEIARMTGVKYDALRKRYSAVLKKLRKYADRWYKTPSDV